MQFPLDTFVLPAVFTEHACSPLHRHFYLRARSDEHDYDEENGKNTPPLPKEPSLGSPSAVGRQEFTFMGSGFAQ